ncbi:MAG: SH3 domain-containing protein [Prevotella sp.]|nr:SH3 domain-containing protein [Prevotella sp.]
MKKTIQIALLIAAAISFASCGNEKKEEPKEQPSEEVTKVAESTITEGTDSDGNVVKEEETSEGQEIDQPVVEDEEEGEAVESGDEESEEEEAVSIPKGKMMYVYSAANDGYTNIRKEPSVNAKVVGGLVNNGPGAKLLEKTSNGWYKVDLNGVVGYVSSKIVAIGDEDGPYTPIPKKNVKDASANTKQKVYYVVMGSWSSLEKAKSYYQYAPEALEIGRIYKTSANGKPVYRIAIACYKSRENAQKKVGSIKKLLGRDAWIWESQGLGQCVYCPKGYDGEPTKPFQPV